MKKRIALLLSVCMTLGLLAGCSKKEESGPAPEAPAQEEPYSSPDLIDPPESRPADQAENLPAPAKRTPDIRIAFLDEEGNSIELEDTGRISSLVMGLDEMEAQEALELDGFTYETFTLVLDGSVQFPVELHRVDLEDYALTKSAVAEDAGYAGAVAWAVEQGITAGTGDGTTFSPDATCTRGQIATFLYRAAEK